MIYGYKVFIGLRHADISGHFTKYFSNELNQPQDLPNDQTETESIRVDINLPNVNNDESPNADIVCCNFCYPIIVWAIIVWDIIVVLACIHYLTLPKS